MDGRSKKEIESAVSEAMTKFLKEQMGETADRVMTQIVGDAIIVRFRGILPPAERHMIKDQQGESLIKELKVKLIEKAKPLLEVIIKDVTAAEVVDIHSSFNVASDEWIEIFTLDKNLGEIIAEK